MLSYCNIRPLQIYFHSKSFTTYHNDSILLNNLAPRSEKTNGSKTGPGNNENGLCDWRCVPLYVRKWDLCEHLQLWIFWVNQATRHSHLILFGPKTWYPILQSKIFFHIISPKARSPFCDVAGETVKQQMTAKSDADPRFKF